jgi:hypothetical protein
VTVRATESNSGLTYDFSFVLTVRCATSINPSSTYANQSYFVGATAISFSVFYVPTPSTCPKSISYVATLSNGDPLPVGITFTSPTFTIYSADFNAAGIGIHTVKITATDTVNTLINNSVTFTVTIKCVTSISVATNPLTSTTIY